jgi:hypothetical protein
MELTFLITLLILIGAINAQGSGAAPQLALNDVITLDSSKNSSTLAVKYYWQLHKLWPVQDYLLAYYQDNKGNQIPVFFQSNSIFSSTANKTINTNF